MTTNDEGNLWVRVVQFQNKGSGMVSRLVHSDKVVVGCINGVNRKHSFH